MKHPGTTIQKQAPTALLALVQHIHEHALGTPLSITAPTTAAPYFDVSVPSHAVDAWVARGLEVDKIHTRPLTAGNIGGRPWERVEITGRLQPHGIRVCLSAARPATAQLQLVPEASA